MKKNNIKVAEFSFQILSVIGFWRPIIFTSIWKIRLYNLCTIILLIFKYYFPITFLINLYYNLHDPQIVIENVFFFTSTFLIALKITYLNLSRQKIISLINMFLQKNCLPQNKEESAILEKYYYKERLVRRNFNITTVHLMKLNP